MGIYDWWYVEITNIWSNAKVGGSSPSWRAIIAGTSEYQKCSGFSLQLIAPEKHLLVSINTD